VETPKSASPPRPSSKLREIPDSEFQSTDAEPQSGLSVPALSFAARREIPKRSSTCLVL
jgi:hypothetical protein